jgi:hypothetical protein
MHTHAEVLFRDILEAHKNELWIQGVKNEERGRKKGVHLVACSGEGNYISCVAVARPMQEKALVQTTPH